MAGTASNSLGGSKLTFAGVRVLVPALKAESLLTQILLRKGCSDATSAAVAAHLVDTELSGVESHGIMRVLQYAEQYDSGYMRADTEARAVRHASGLLEVDGGGGIGIPAMQLAVATCCTAAKEKGIEVLPLRNVGHTGRLGAFAECGAETGCLVMIVGGGGRQNWRQVAPYGGRRAILPTNPFCFAIPGGDNGPVVVDFATSVIAGGWLYAARSAGGQVPEGALIDRDGSPSRDPNSYFDGGAILPKGGAMGYGLAVMGEMICEAMLGPVSTEVNWLILAIDTQRYRERHIMQEVAEEILAELRACPPADGFARVEVPGERERDRKRSNPERMISSPENTWAAIVKLSCDLGITF